MDVSARIQRTAQWFSQHLRHQAGRSGWGQFIDAPGGASPQIGWYGTVAGIGLLGLMDTQPTKSTIDWLSQTWQARHTQDKAASYFAQTPRLAVALLALFAATDASLVTIRTEIAAELVQRRLPNGTWGDWFASPQERDHRTSPDSSALALIALASRVTNMMPEERARSAKALNRALRESSSPDPERSILPLAAIASCLPPAELGNNTGALIRAALRHILHRDDGDFVSYSYGYSLNGATHYDRDYLVLPKLMAQLILASRAGGVISPLLAKRAVRRAVSIFPEDTDYLYGRSQASAATLDQFLIAYSITEFQKAGLSTIDAISKFLLWIIDERNVLVRLLAPILMVTVAAVCAADPMLFTSVPCIFKCLPDPTPHKDSIRLSAIVFMAILGRPLVDQVIGYFRRQFGSDK